MEGLKIYVVIGGFSLLADALLQGSSVCFFFKVSLGKKMVSIQVNNFALGVLTI